MPTRLTALGHPQRLAVFRLLMRRHPDRVAAGELADALNVKASTLSAYLTTLMRAGLVSQSRAGTSLRYGIDMAQVRDTLDYLLLDCCQGRPQCCLPLSRLAPDTERGDETKAPRYRVLFVCHGNATRSILAESLLRHEAGGRFEVFSAGTQPAAEVNPLALSLLEQAGHDTTGLHSKSLQTFQHADGPVWDFVLTVCDRAANTALPAWRGLPLCAHWGVPAPGAHNALPERQQACQRSFTTLRQRILALAALPLDTMDRTEKQQALDTIATLSDKEPA